MHPRHRLIILTSVLFVFCASSAWAQRFEVTPFGGYRWGGSVNVEREDVDVTKLRIDNGTTYGAAFGVDLGDSFQVEFMWSQQASALTGEGPSGDTELFDLKTDHYHVNFLPHFGEEGATFRTFLLFGVGMTTFYPGTDMVENLSKLSYGFGGGVKGYESERIGIRAQVRFAPTYISSNSSGVFCDSFGCFLVPDNNYAYQVEATFGVLFRF